MARDDDTRLATLTLTPYCLIRGCSRAGGDCLTRMFPVPHLYAPVAA